MHRAYSIFEVKSIDDERRVFSGMATTPTPDRVDDVIDPLGVEFQNPTPLLLFHDKRQPVGSVIFSAPTPEGVPFEASIPSVAEAGTLKQRVDEAWHSVKYGVIRAVSIGYGASSEHMKPRKSGGWHFLKSKIFELSLVPVPANTEATITSIKSIDAAHLAALGNGDGTTQVKTPGASGTPVVRLLPSRQERTMKTISEQIAGFQSTRDQKFNEMNALMTKSAETGDTLDEAQGQQYETLKGEVEACDKHIARLKELEAFNKAAAVVVTGGNQDDASRSRAAMPVISVKENLPPGIGFARMVMAKVVARLDHRYVLDVAKEMFPSDARLLGHFQKANVAAGSTTNSVNAAALVDPQNLMSEFIEFLRPATIIGKFGTNGIPSLTRVPFNIRVTGQNTGGTGYWVGEGKPKPLTNFEFGASTLAYTKVAAISVITQELARFSTPSAEMLVRNGLRDALVERIDVDLIDPALAAVANVSPASLTNGLTPLSSAGTSADNVRTDVQNLIEQYITSNQDVGSLVLIIPNTLALVLSFMVNTLGQREFPGMTLQGGNLLGIPVIASQYAANASGSGNLAVAVNAREVFLADDGEVTVDMSTEASLQMLDNPTNDTVTPTPTTMVSLWQTNSIGLRAERFINWQKRRANAVVFMDDVNWGAIGSPA